MKKDLDLINGNMYKNILEIAIPASTAFVFNTLFNITDTLFTSTIGTDALAGLSLSFPLFFIVISIGAGLSTGVTSLIGNSIGAGDYEKVKRIVKNSFALSLIIALIATIISLAILPKTFDFMKANTQTSYYGIEYMKYIYLAFILFILNYLLNGFLVAKGDTKTYRNFVIFGFFLNIFLDYLFTVYYNFETKGVAFGTIIVQGLGFFYLFYHFRKTDIYKNSFGFLFDKDLFKDILKQAIPATLSMLTIVIGSFIINYFVSITSDSKGLAAYGIALRIEQVLLLPTIGLNSAVLSITSQNFGGRRYENITLVYKKALFIALSFLTFAMFILFFFSHIPFKLFTKEVDIINIGVGYFKVEAFVLYTYSIQTISISILQGMKKPKFAIYIGLLRQLILPLFIFNILSTMLGLKGIWYGIFIINWLAVFITIFYTRKNLVTIL